MGVSLSKLAMIILLIFLSFSVAYSSDTMHTNNWAVLVCTSRFWYIKILFLALLCFAKCPWFTLRVDILNGLLSLFRFNYRHMANTLSLYRSAYNLALFLIVLFELCLIMI